MPPLPLQLRLEDYQVAAIDAVREVRNHGTGLTAHLSRQQVISAIIDQWIEAHAAAPPSPPVVVPLPPLVAPCPEAGEVLGQMAAEGAAASPETRTTSQAVSPRGSPQDLVLAVVPTQDAMPEGLGRLEIVKVTQLSETQVDNALQTLRTRQKVRTVTPGHYVRA
jgi:hypothetical protein